MKRALQAISFRRFNFIDVVTAITAAAAANVLTGVPAFAACVSVIAVGSLVSSLVQDVVQP